MNRVLSPAELDEAGFARLGSNVRIDRSAALFGTDRIEIGSNVRIDCFCVISGGPAPVVIGSHVHLSAGVHIFGSAGVEIDDFCSLSSRVSVFSVNDDYTDGYLTNPTVPEEFRRVTAGAVSIRRHVVIGCGSVVLPGVTIGTGAAVGALTLVNRSVPEFEVVGGVPFRSLGRRDAEKLAEMEGRFRQSRDGIDTAPPAERS